MSMSEPSSLSGYPRRGGGQDKSACHRLSMVRAADDSSESEQSVVTPV
jgi:hypothetical protein